MRLPGRIRGNGSSLFLFPFRQAKLLLSIVYFLDAQMNYTALLIIEPFSWYQITTMPN